VTGAGRGVHYGLGFAPCGLYKQFLMKRFALAFFLVCAGSVLASEGDREFDFGFIASRLRDPNGDLRVRALGPFLEWAESTNGLRFSAFRPLSGTVTDPAAERKTRYVLWPVATVRRFRDDFFWRVILAFYNDYDVDDPRSHYRFRIFPIYFQGRDVYQRSYAGLFPVGGRICDFLGRDQIDFVLFPLYAKHSVNEVVSREVLWPIYSRTEGKGIDRFRVFPFYGRAAHRDVFKKRFIMWPFWTWAKYEYPASPGTAYVVWPLWGHFDMENQQAWLFLPPLFRFSRGDRLNYGYAPWPLVQWSSGEIEKFYLFPLWGQKRMRGVKTSFLLWPIFWRERMDVAEGVSRRFMALPFVQAGSTTADADQPGGEPRAVSGFFKLWPLMSYERQEDARRLRVLDLWPVRNAPPVERCYAPLWTLYSRTAVGEAVDSELLWGLYRHRRRGEEMRSVSLFPLAAWQRDDRGAGRREWSLLQGLVGWRREGTQRSLRVLYFLRFGGKEKKP
jgi:hypothetical protein